MGKPGTRGGGFRPGSAADRRVKKRAAALLNTAKNKADAAPKIAKLRRAAREEGK